MSNDDKLSSIIRTLSLADSNLENLIANQDELTVALNLAADYGLMITHNNGLYTLENKLKILDKSIIYNHLELLNSDMILNYPLKILLILPPKNLIQERLRVMNLKSVLQNFKSKEEVDRIGNGFHHLEQAYLVLYSSIFQKI